MKKFIALLLLVSLVLCVSCTKAPENDEPVDDPVEKVITDNLEEVKDETEEENREAADPEIAEVPVQGDVTYSVKLQDGRVIELGSAAEAVISSLGDYTDMYEAPSCVHEGFDRVYTYGGFSVTTSPDENGEDIVTEFAIESSDCVLDGGLTVGSTVEEMENIFGDAYEESFGFIKYSFDGADVSFVSGDGVLSSILFTYTGK